MRSTYLTLHLPRFGVDDDLVLKRDHHITVGDFR